MGREDRRMKDFIRLVNARTGLKIKYQTFRENVKELRKVVE